MRWFVRKQYIFNTFYSVCLKIFKILHNWTSADKYAPILTNVKQHSISEKWEHCWSGSGVRDQYLSHHIVLVLLLNPSWLVHCLQYLPCTLNLRLNKEHSWLTDTHMNGHNYGSFCIVYDIKYALLQYNCYIQAFIFRTDIRNKWVKRPRLLYWSNYSAGF